MTTPSLSHPIWVILTILALTGFLPAAPHERATPKPPPAAELFTDDRVTTLELEVSADDMSGLRKTQKFKGMGERQSYTITVREGNQVYPGVEMHLKGAIGSFRPIDENPALTLSFAKHGGPAFHGLKKISLNNSVQDGALVSEKFSRELFRKAGVPAPRVGYATVRLNGRDLGVYLLVEGYNRQFLQPHFNPDGNLYDGGLGKEISTDGTQPVNSGRAPKDQSRLKDLVAAAEEPDLDSCFRRLEAVVDMDRFVSTLALDVLINNWDGYALGRNNYRMFHDLDSNRIIFLPHGLDQTFQGAEATIVPRVPGLIARSLLQTAQGRRSYLNRLEQLVNQQFDVAAWTNRVRQISATPHAEIARRDAKKGREHDDAVTAYCAQISKRADSVRRQLAGIRRPLRWNGTEGLLLTDWKPSTAFGSAELQAGETPGATLEIAATHGPTIASWTTKAWLEAGRYRLEGRMKTRSVTPVRGDLQAGASLRTGNRPITSRELGDTEWKTLQFDFEVQDPLYEMTFVCELRASGGSVLFDRQSLRLHRLSGD